MRGKLRDSLSSVLATIILSADAMIAMPSLARTPDFTIEQVMSAPFPSSLTAAEAGGKVAWVFDDRGVRNIWVAEPGANGYAARQLTTYAGDDGSDMGQVAWDPAGKTVFYIRGGSLEGGGPVNIMSRPEGAPG